MNNSVVVSGISAVSPLGLNFSENLQNLLIGKDAFSDIESFDTSPFSTSIGGEIKSLIGAKGKYLKIFDTLINELLIDADLKKDDLKKTALFIGSSFIGIEGEKVKKTDFYIKELKKNYGFINVIVNTNTCAASNFSVNSAYNIVKSGFYDYVICGGIEILTRYLFAGFDSIRSLSKSYPKPFSRDRDGLIPGEGGALLVLENEERLKRRNKKGYCKILGFGSSVDNCNVTSMDKSGLGIKKCFEEALSKGGVKTEEIDLISSHGTATRLNDAIEGNAIIDIFGPKPYIQAFKSYYGHTMGASSAIQIALLSKTFQTNQLIKIKEINNEEFDLNYVRDNIEKKINFALNNAFGFGGINSSLLLGSLD